MGDKDDAGKTGGIKPHANKADTRRSGSFTEEPEDEFDFMMQKYGSNSSASSTTTTLLPGLGGGTWKLHKKHFIQIDHAKVACANFLRASSLLVVGLDSGIFGLYDMPGCVNIHTLSISQHAINTVAINDSGEWLAFGSAALGQLLVWEWRSETYVLKQQGHFYDLNVLAYSPDGRLMATGGDDSKVKLWNSITGFCFVTFSDHDGPVTAVEFACGETGNAVVSASLDRTVRAFDLARYKNFRTMRTPEARTAQLLCLAVDGGGEIVCAGAMEPYEIYVWSLRNGQLLDVLTGHEGPICGLSFSPADSMLASASWDRTVGLWEPYKSTVPKERFKHKSDVLSVAFRPDGEQVCVSTLDGQLAFWDVQQGKQDGYIQGRRDIAGGRRQNDTRSATLSAQGKCFTSVVYTADGTCVLAGGRSKFVCIYQVGQRVLLKKFQLSHNRSFDGVLNFLNSANMTEAGPAHLLGDSSRSDSGAASTALPGAARGGMSGKRQTLPEIRCKSVRFSPTGRSWAAATTEGLVVYSLRDDATFTPFELTEEITPATVALLSRKGSHGKALLVALHLSEPVILRAAILAVPVESVGLVATTIPQLYLHSVLEVLAKILTETTHLEFVMQFCLALFRAHGPQIRRASGIYLRSLRSLQKALSVHFHELKRMGDTTKYLLDYVTLPLQGESNSRGARASGSLEPAAKKMKY
jgi:periodic tryptophan protein 2